MGSTPEEIVSSWREQMQKGYLKLAILFVLIKSPLHGYQILKHVRKRTLGVITPTPGALYPALKELEDKGIVMGEWRLNERRKVYHVTGKGRGVFREAVQRHFEHVSSIRDWFLKGADRAQGCGAGGASSDYAASC